MINVVGNAKKLLEQSNGKLIDQGTVIRFNWGGIVKPMAQGVKTHIVVTGLKHVKKTAEIYPTAIIMPTDSVPFSNTSKHAIKECDWTSSGFRVLYWLYAVKAKDVNLFGFDWDETGVYYPYGWRGDRHNYPIEKKIIGQWTEDNKWKIH